MQKQLHMFSYKLQLLLGLFLYATINYAQKVPVVSNTLTIAPPKTININAPECMVAKDSLLKRNERGEISFYTPIQYNNNQLNYIVINKERYIKKTINKTQIPTTFLACFNKGIQKKIDSIYKVDFFRKSDSILGAYDKTGRGYRNADFPGGAVALNRFLAKNINLPKDIKSDNDQKTIRVYYAFVVNEIGEISDIKLVKSNCKACESAVLDAVNKLPKFITATEAGIAKSVKYILPFIR